MSRLVSSHTFNKPESEFDMSATIKDCKVDPEFRDVVPPHSWDEAADLKASVEKFGYLSPIVVWKSEAVEFLVLDGHARRDIWLAAVSAAHAERSANPEAPIGRAARWPQIVEIELPDRDAALLWVIDNQRGRRNLTDLDRIALAAKREQVVRRMAKSNQSAGGGDKKSVVAKSGLALAPKAVATAVNTRAECAKAAGVGERTYGAGKLILSAVEQGTAPAEVIEDIRHGRATIHGVAKNLKGETVAKPNRKAKSKSSGWQAIVRLFSKAICRVAKRDPRCRAEVAAELRRLADDFDTAEKAAA